MSLSRGAMHIGAWAIAKHASTWLAMPVVLAVAYFYTVGVGMMRGSAAYSLAVTAFGLVAALAAVCLSTSGPVGRESTPAVLKRAGLRLMHSSVLLLQAVFLVYGRDTALGLSWIAHTKWLVTLVVLVAWALLVMVATAAAVSFYAAVDELNNELWGIWMEGSAAYWAERDARFRPPQGESKTPPVTPQVAQTTQE